MKTPLAICLLAALGFFPAQAQPPAGAAPAASAGGEGKPAADASGINEADRLMQEYMARRAEWVALRQAALDRAAAAKTTEEKSRVAAQLADDEKPLLGKVSAAAQAYRAALKAKQDAALANQPRG